MCQHAVVSFVMQMYRIQGRHVTRCPFQDREWTHPVNFLQACQNALYLFRRRICPDRNSCAVSMTARFELVNWTGSVSVPLLVAATLLRTVTPDEKSFPASTAVTISRHRDVATQDLI